MRLRSSGTAPQKNFIITYYIVELSKLYRMVSESWESVQAKRFVPLFLRGTIFFTRADSMQKRGYRGAHGRLGVIQLERVDSKRVVLPVHLCLES